MVTKEEFLTHYYPPSKFMKFLNFFYKTNFEYLYSGIYITAFLILLISESGYYTEWSSISKICFWCLVSLIPIVFLSILIVLNNNRRIKKIIKNLDISLDDFYYYEQKYIN